MQSIGTPGQSTGEGGATPWQLDEGRHNTGAAQWRTLKRRDSTRLRAPNRQGQHYCGRRKAGAAP